MTRQTSTMAAVSLGCRLLICPAPLLLRLLVAASLVPAPVLLLPLMLMLSDGVVIATVPAG